MTNDTADDGKRFLPILTITALVRESEVYMDVNIDEHAGARLRVDVLRRIIAAAKLHLDAETCRVRLREASERIAQANHRSDGGSRPPSMPA